MRMFWYSKSMIHFSGWSDSLPLPQTCIMKISPCSCLSAVRPRCGLAGSNRLAKMCPNTGTRRGRYGGRTPVNWWHIIIHSFFQGFCYLHSINLLVIARTNAPIHFFQLLYVGSKEINILEISINRGPEALQSYINDFYHTTNHYPMDM